MAQKTAAGEYLAISIQAAKAAGAALTDAQAAAEAGDVAAAQDAAKRAAEESVIAEQAWEKLEHYRKGIATEKTAKALTNRDAAADNARLAKDFVKTARRKAKEMAKESAVFDQMAEAPAEAVKVEEWTFTNAAPAWTDPEAEPVAAPEPALEGEIVEAAPVDGDGMPPALDLDALAIPARTGFAEIDTEAVTVDYVAEAQKNAEAAELHANSAKSYAEDGNASGARTSAMLAHAAAKRTGNFAQAAAEAGHENAEDAQGYADMAAEYAAAAKGHRQTAEDVEAARRVQPDPVVTEALAEIADDSPQAAPEAPEPAGDVPEAPEAVTEPQAGAEDVQARAEAVAVQHEHHADRLAAARELAGPAIGEQAALILDPADLAGRLATIAQDAAAAAIYWGRRGNAAAAEKLAGKSHAAAMGATACAEESEPDAGAAAVHSRRAWSWAAAAARASLSAHKNAAG